MSDAYTQRFKRGLEERGIDYDDVVNNWKYCGGDSGAHLKYWALTNPDMDVGELDRESKCICGHAIRRNCFISKGDGILILGSCCIKRFMKNSGRTCSQCGAKHKTRKYDLCRECKPKY
jgi:hypothetical protein